MKIYYPPKNTLFLWQIRLNLLLVLVLLLNLWIFAFSSVFLGIFIFLFAVSLFFTVFYFPKYFKNYSLTLKENALILKSGVFVLRERIMPYPRMVYAERRQTPISKILGVTGLILHATRAATFTVEFGNNDVFEIMEAISGE